MGFNRRGARNLIYTYKGGCRGNIGQLDEVLIVKNTGQFIKRGDISLVSKRGGNRSPSIRLSVYSPLL